MVKFCVPKGWLLAMLAQPRHPLGTLAQGSTHRACHPANREYAVPPACSRPVNKSLDSRVILSVYKYITLFLVMQ